MKLKKCPCCGGDAQKKVINFVGTKIITCKECGLRTAECMEMEQAIERWNATFEHYEEPEGCERENPDFDIDQYERSMLSSPGSRAKHRRLLIYKLAKIITAKGTGKSQDEKRKEKSLP